jgi:tetratricopeptide (TPR) repeat protein
MYLEAISVYKEVLHLSPNIFNAYLGLAKAHLQGGDGGKAIEAVKEAMKIDSTSERALSLMQKIFRRRILGIPETKQCWLAADPPW